MEGQNGQLAGYELIYQRVSGEGGGGLGDKVKGPPIPAEQKQTVLEGLEKWSWYNLSMAAYTVEGSGPSSLPALCRTDEDGENQSDPREYTLAAGHSIHFVYSIFSSGCSAPPRRRPAHQLLSTAGNLAARVATVTARPNPWLPSTFQPGRER